MAKPPTSYDNTTIGSFVGFGALAIVGGLVWLGNLNRAVSSEYGSESEPAYYTALGLVLVGTLVALVGVIALGVSIGVRNARSSD